MRVKTLAVGLLEANAHILWDPTSKEAVVVDCGGDADRIEAFLATKELKAKYIVLTHGHVDHIAGASDLKRLTGAQIVIHEQDAEMTEDPHKNASRQFPIPPVSFKADVLVKDADILMLGEAELKIVHTPGHTKGGICIVAGEYIATGDTLFKGSIGRTDLYGGDMNALRKSLVKLADLPHRLIVLSGHGGQSTIRDEVRSNPYMR
ncbi:MULTISPECIES: MBL fold metallo-hydrolase [unclassified Fusibacter]|uniref:MBL fold metallo-hydrolase n=1 Tax=unclassified Fusibacter TaxID=2624464 RepID=UPI0010133969|nr:MULTISPECIES: MBL fold metallo-hydrolase [unclassified Fusibacter]MCK8059031.1 MBL fold metallo-hydrolase [Fusibacter sp. A2]NPE22442.1 MBL fold metallo-hydrolase [Fusibacter sp. A1]RXV60547.1 MBL fold metallo-hydrolase [Fusibacter sp. A1]